ncbi:MAG: hypothetical protein IJP64_05755 [Oscillospiraceae bacterium]|nr:hypothetical protein [Oscillospiraceae bacterium]
MSKQITALLCEADRERAQPILDALRQKGFAVADESNKTAPVLLFLSAAFAADGGLQERFFALESAGREIIPVDLDGAAQPELVKAALIAKNAIASQGRTAEEIASRVASAEAFQKKSVSPKLSRLLIAAAALLILGAAVWIWRANAPGKTEPNADEAVLAFAQERYGLSAEDLAEIRYVYIVSDGFYPLREDESEKTYTIFPNRSMEEDGMHWTSHEDGHRIYASEWDVADWEVLRLMPNMEGLIIVLADAGSLPDLSGLEHLSWMQIIDSKITDISGLSGSSLDYFGNFRCPVEDYSPLTSCERLDSVVMEFDFLQKADLSACSPPALEYASFGYGREPLELDLSGLKSCPALEELTLKHLPTLRDLDCLTGLPNLKTLTLEDLRGLQDASALGTLPRLETLELKELELRDISGVRTLGSLKELSIDSCPNIRDFSPIDGCTALEHFHIWGCYQFSDASFLASLPELHTIELFDVDLPDLDFLSALPADREMSLAFSGPIRDYSALGHFRSYDGLHVNPHDGNVAPVLDALQGVSVRRLHFHECRGLDLAALPEVTESLEIWYGDLYDLSGMPALSIRDLQLYDLPYLTSLNGLEKLPTFSQNDALGLRITGCPRLTDWSALEGASINSLTLAHVYSLPALESMEFATLKLEGVEVLTDLHFLDGKPEGWHYHEISLVDQEQLRDLTPLRRLEGEKLTVGPQLAEQAEELVELGAVREYEIEYPEDGWVAYDGEQILLSLGELDTLPKALLRSVRQLCLAGDVSVDPRYVDIAFRMDEKGRDVPVLVDRDTGEETPIEPGTLTALPELSALSELQELQIVCQALHDLEGVQGLDALETARINLCGELTDASALFTLQSLRVVDLWGCPVSSLQGVQNLTELEELNIADTAVTDLTPLLELPTLRRVTVNGEMRAAIASLDGQDLPFELEIW